MAGLGQHRRYPTELNAKGIAQTASATVINPYSSPTTPESPRSTQSPAWLHRIIVLNLTLLFIPFACLVAVYTFIRLSSTWGSATQTGDPVVYQHFFWIDVDRWFATAYFLVPNGILAALFARWKFRSTKDNLSNDDVT